jgi:hypothetical protein
VKDVVPIRNNYKNGTNITLQLLEQMPMPVTVKITTADGETMTMKLPVEVWQRGDTWTFPVKTKSEVKEVVVDPELRLPDMNAKNNSWKK